MNLIQSDIKTMTTLEVAGLVESRHDNVVTSAKRLAARLEWALPAMQDKTKGRPVTYYELDKNQSLTLVAQLMPEFLARVVDRWQELEEQAAKPLTQLEIIAGMATGLVEIERKQNEHARVVARLENEIQEVKKGQDNNILLECPANAEGITAAKARVNNKYGIPGWAVDEILRGEYGPRPAGQVRNTHENANGGTYVVWYKGDVTRLFDRITKESTRVTPTNVTHPQVSKRFKLIEGVK